MLENLVDNIFVLFLSERSSRRQSAFKLVRIVPLFSPTSFCIYTKLNLYKLALKKLLAPRFNLTYRYIDDLLSLNTPEFEHYLGQMYPAALEIKNTTENTTSALYQDLLLSMGGMVNFTLPFMTNEMISISTSQTFHS